MAPALSQFTWAFRDNISGWTESWYSGGTYTQAQAGLIASGYLDARMPLMGVGISSTFARYRALNGTGLSYKFNLPRVTTTAGGAPTNSSGVVDPTVTPKLPIYAGSPDRPYSCLMLTMVALGQPQKRIFLSGIPDNVIIDPSGPFFPGGYLNGLNTLITGVNAVNLGWNSVGGAAGNPKYPITAVNAAAGTVTTAAGAFAVGTHVGVYGFRGLKGYRGKYYVTASAGGVITLGGYSPPASLGNPPAAYIRAVGVNFVLCPTTISGFAEVSHKRGKGLGVPVGRRKARSN